MKRHRQIAAAPQRLASETWEVISQLVVDTLDRSPTITTREVREAMTAASRAGIMLVAGGHLDLEPLVVVADPVHLSITTVSGSDAVGLEENLNPVPGGASASEWTIYLPAPNPLDIAVADIVTDVSHVSVEAAPKDVNGRVAASASTLDLQALEDRDTDR